MNERMAVRAVVVYSIYNSCKDAFNYISSLNYLSVITSIQKRFF